MVDRRLRSICEELLRMGHRDKAVIVCGEETVEEIEKEWEEARRKHEEFCKACEPCLDPANSGLCDPDFEFTCMLYC